MDNRKRKAALVLAAAIVLALGASAWADVQGGVPLPSASPWIYDFGTGWLTVEMRGYIPGMQVILKKVDAQDENTTKSAVPGLNSLIAGIQIVQAVPSAGSSAFALQEVAKFDGAPPEPGTGTERSSLVLVFHFKSADLVPAALFLIPDGGDLTTDSVRLDTNTMKGNKLSPRQQELFDVDLARPSTKLDSSVLILTVRRWPKGDPKVGN
jgi:hypothetical protein